MTANEIIRAAAEHGVTVGDMLKIRGSQAPQIFNARRSVCLVLHGEGRSDVWIGLRLGGRTSWTILHYRKSKAKEIKPLKAVKKTKPLKQKIILQCDRCGKFTGFWKNVGGNKICLDLCHVS